VVPDGLVRSQRRAKGVWCGISRGDIEPLISVRASPREFNV
jgi:hypothetical protein